MLAPCLPTLGAMQHEDQMPLLAAAMAEHNRSGRQHLREATQMLRKMKPSVKVEKVEKVEKLAKVAKVAEVEQEEIAVSP